MALSRCPECGRVADGVACFACGYEWPAEAAPVEAAAPAAPKQEPVSAAPVASPAPAAVDVDPVSPLAFGASAPAPLNDPMAEAGLEFDFSDDGPLDGGVSDGFDADLSDGFSADVSDGFDAALGLDIDAPDLTEPLDRAAMPPSLPPDGPHALDVTEPIAHHEITNVLGTPDPTEQFLRPSTPPDVGLAAAAPMESLPAPSLPADEALPYSTDTSSIDVSFDPFDEAALPADPPLAEAPAAPELPQDDLPQDDLPGDTAFEAGEPAFDPFADVAAPSFDPFGERGPVAPPAPPTSAAEAFDPFSVDVGGGADVDFDPFGASSSPPTSSVSSAAPPAPAPVSDFDPFGVDVAPPPASSEAPLEDFSPFDEDVSKPATSPAAGPAPIEAFDPFEADASSAGEANFDPFADVAAPAASKPGATPPPPPDEEIDLSVDADVSDVSIDDLPDIEDLPDLDDLPNMDLPAGGLDDLPDLDDLAIDDDLAEPAPEASLVPAASASSEPGLSDRVGVLAEQLEVEGRVIEASLLYEVQAVLSALGR